MSAIDTLIRLARLEVDRLSKALAQLEVQIGAAQRRVLAHESDIARQQAEATAHQDALFAYGGYARAAIAQRHTLAQDRAGLERQSSAIRETLREAFIELKKLETLAEQEAARARAAEDRIAAASLDEQAIQAAARRAG